MTTKLTLASEMEALVSYDNKRYKKVDNNQLDASPEVMKISERQNEFVAIVNAGTTTRKVTLAKKNLEINSTSEEEKVETGTGADVGAGVSSNSGESSGSSDPVPIIPGDPRPIEIDEGEPTLGEPTFDSPPVNPPMEPDTVHVPNIKFRINGVEKPYTGFNDMISELSKLGLLITTNSGRFSVINTTDLPLTISYMDENKPEETPFVSDTKAVVLNDVRPEGNFFNINLPPAPYPIGEIGLNLTEPKYDLYIETTKFGDITPEQVYNILNQNNFGPHSDRVGFVVLGNYNETTTYLRLRVTGAGTDYDWSGKYVVTDTTETIGPWLTIYVGQSVPLAD